MTWGDEYLRQEADQAVVADLCRKGNGIEPWNRAQKSMRPPWIDFPALGRFFPGPAVIATPALGTTNAILLTINMPAGWDGVIRLISFHYTGAGLVQGSGDLSWSLRVAGAIVEEYNAVTVTTDMGTGEPPWETYVRVFENQSLELLVSVAAAAAIPIAGTQVIGRLSGWRWPRDIGGRA